MLFFSEQESRFWCCRHTIVELFKYKEKIAQYSSLDEDEILEVLYNILKRLSFFDENYITDDSVRQAFALCSNVDEKDTPILALTIELQGMLWTGDEKLKEGLKKKGFDSSFEVNE